MMQLELQKTLAVFDIEATGTSPRADRIVEMAIVRLAPDGSRASSVFRLNPGIPIPEEATRIHGISDADVADSPTFADKAPEILELLSGCDLGGYNILRYDIPMITAEFLRAGIRFDIEDRSIIDAQRIFHRKEPRDLTAALAFYCNEEHADAHGAKADVEATIRVLNGELQRYPDIPHDVAGLNEYCNPRNPAWVDRSGKLKWEREEIVLNFGRKKGLPLRQLVEHDPQYINWILKSDFPRDMREIVENATQGIWPSPPEGN